MKEQFSQPKTPEQLSENIIETVKNNNFNQEQIEALISKLNTIILEEKPKEVNDNLDTKSEVKLNHVGLPENWSHDRSVQGLEYLKKQLENYNLENKIPEQVLKHIFDITSNEYKKYKGQNGPVYTSSVGADFASELEHLKMNQVEKIEHFKKRWPQGLQIMDTNRFMKWEKVLDYELWAMGNHDQTLYTLQRRGGLTPKELVKIIFGINTDEFQNKTDESILKWFEDKNMLAS